METNKTESESLHLILDSCKNGFGLFENDGNDGQSLLAYIKNDESDKQEKAARIVKCVNGYDSLLEENKRLKDALEGIINLFGFCINATPKGAIRDLLTDANIIAKTVWDLSTVKEDGNNG